MAVNLRSSKPVDKIIDCGGMDPHLFIDLFNLENTVYKYERMVTLRGTLFSQRFIEESVLTDFRIVDGVLYARVTNAPKCAIPLKEITATTINNIHNLIVVKLGVQ